jgi:hypothetical protein
MNNTRRFAMTIESLVELADEIKAAQADPQPALPSLSEVLAEYSPMPREALFLGLASDGLPVLLNLHDAVPGPLLITGDAGSGKTTLLQTIATAAEGMHSPEDLQYEVIASHIDEWNNFEKIPNCVGIHHSKDGATSQLLVSLASWAHSNKGNDQSVLLLIDDLESVTNLDLEAKQALRWLLLRGPSHRVWPIVTLNSTRAVHVYQWLEFFRTRLFGHMENPVEGRALTGSDDANTQELMAGVQFLMREGNEWLPFWLPGLS